LITDLISLKEPRDPRFLPFAGQLKLDTFRKQYEFLSEMHVTELDTLKDHLKRAKKLLISSPRHLREEREQEVARLESALKRAESSVNRDKRERVEQQALARVKKEESGKRKAGKSAWYMKNGKNTLCECSFFDPDCRV
jgi:ribosomal RNA-processing protein 36